MEEEESVGQAAQLNGIVKVEAGQTTSSRYTWVNLISLALRPIARRKAITDSILVPVPKLGVW